MKMKKRRKIRLCQEFMLATDMTASGSPEEKLRWAFKMYDKDGSGALTLQLSRIFVDKDGSGKTWIILGPQFSFNRLA